MTNMLKRCIVGGVVFGFAAMCIVPTLAWGRQDIDVGWDGGRLKASETAYYSARIGRIGDYWRRTAEKAGRRKDGRINEPYPTYLVIDTLKPAMWLETAGEVDPNNFTELAKNMKWKLYRTSPAGNEALGPAVRLKIRGLRKKQLFPESVCVHGYGRAPGHLSIYITAGRGSADYGAGAFTIQTCNEQFKEGVDYYHSIIVDEQEYEDIISSLKGLDKEIAELKRAIASELPKNIAKWLEAEKQLYMEIERQSLEMGFEVSKMRISAGPDCTAGHAAVLMCEDTALKNRSRPSMSGGAYLKIDYLGNDIWYLRGAADTDNDLKRLMQPGEPIQLEFLVTAAGPLSKAEGQTWLEKGRNIQPAVVNTALAHRATLANGASVAFFGICSNTSGGKRWWGPDGSLLDHSPYDSAVAPGGPDENMQAYEMAWRISVGRRISKSTIMSGDSRTATTRITLEGHRIRQELEGLQEYYQVIDRYGHDLEDLGAYGYVFENDRKKTTWKVGVGVGDDDLQWVEFRSISLVPGQDFGFEIVQGAAIAE
ncbi:MAG: hypothetical protein ACYTEL_14810 [Planctomycetota bacterium]|jgi:hypothetical protein